MKRRSAFTLIELLISIGLVLVLIYGVTQVFSMTGAAVGGGLAVAEMTRSSRGAQAVFYNDIKQMVYQDGTPLIIRSRRMSAFKFKKDEQGDRDYIVGSSESVLDGQIRTADLNGDNVESTTAPEQTPRAILGERNFRIDTLSFFVRGGPFKRQTGNDGTFVAPMSSGEGWIWYGHLKIPDNAGTYYNPGYGTPGGGSSVPSTTNANNFFANQWVLGRKLMLLRAPDSNFQIFDDAGIAQWYGGRSLAATAASMAPFSQGSQSTLGGPGYTMSNPLVQTSRNDLFGISLDGAHALAANCINNFNGLSSGLKTTTEEWWDLMSDYRFQGSPFVTKPITSQDAAYTLPLFLASCSQFVVEYAGDFLTQDATGLATAATPDGVIDFVVANNVKSVRWYGYPRDVTGPNGVPDGIILGWKAGRTALQLIDVVPLRDIIRTIPTMAASDGLPFEKIVIKNGTLNVLNVKDDYAGLNSTGVALDDNYCCAWGPDTVGQPKPKMLRFMATLEDSSGRVNGQQIEYVINLP